MKLFTGIFLVLAIHQVISMNFSISSEPNSNDEDEQWKILVESLEPMIRNEKPKRNGFYEIVVTSMSLSYDISKFIKYLTQKEDIVVSSILKLGLENQEIEPSTQPDFAFIIIDSFSVVRKSDKSSENLVLDRFFSE